MIVCSTVIPAQLIYGVGIGKICSGLCAAVQSSTKALTLLTSLRLLLEEQLDQLERGDAATTLEQDIQILEVSRSRRSFRALQLKVSVQGFCATSLFL